MRKILSSVFALVFTVPGMAAAPSRADMARAGTPAVVPTFSQPGYAPDDAEVARAGIMSAAVNRAPTPPNSISGAVSNPVPGGSTTPPAQAPKVYSVDNCMDDLKYCVDGALPKGVRSLFSDEVRGQIIGGMSLCGAAVEKCIFEAKNRTGNAAYSSKGDVWTDFNSRIVQPEFYTAVLRSTGGLSPLQAANICSRIDKKVKNKSFTEVETDDNDEVKYSNPSKPYRGKYARWDPIDGTCELRVVAMHKDGEIRKSWLGMGSDEVAEEWILAGKSFACKKDTFNYNLMNYTKGAGLIAGATTGTVALGLAAGAVGQAVSNKLFCKGTGPNGKWGKECIVQTANSNCMVATGAAAGSAATGDDNAEIVAAVGTATDGTCQDKTGAGLAIGAAAVAGAGALAVGITAFIEANQIYCEVGDNLKRVEFGKTGSVPTLKQLMVDWGLKLADELYAPQTVTDCATWNTACGQYKNECEVVGIYYQHPDKDDATTTVTDDVLWACTMDKSDCIASPAIMRSNNVTCP